MDSQVFQGMVAQHEQSILGCDITCRSKIEEPAIHIVMVDLRKKTIDDSSLLDSLLFVTLRFVIYCYAHTAYTMHHYCVT